MMLISLLLSVTLTVSPDIEPKNGNDGCIIFTEFETIQDAMTYVIQDVLLPRRIIPLRYDAEYGILVSERTYYKGNFNCDFILAFKMDNGRVQIDFYSRDYGYSQTTASMPTSYNYYNDKAMKGSPAAAFWQLFSGIVADIPSLSIHYYTSNRTNNN